MLPTNFNVRVQTWLTTIIATQLMSWMTLYLAWATSDPMISIIVNLVASIPASIAASLLILFIVRAYKMADYVAKLAEDAQSDFAGVVMKTDAAAEQFEASKVVGPSEVKTL